MPTIAIDGKEYDLESLTSEAKSQLASLQFVDAELERLRYHVAVLQTARSAYANALREALGPPPAVGASETIRFS